MLVVPASGTLALAKFLATGYTLQPYMGLFVNDYVPDKSTTLADLTEASFIGYARQLIGPPSTVNPQADGSALMLWAPVVFGPSSPPPAETAYGYFVVQLDASHVLQLLWVERMSPVVNFGVPATQVVVNPQLVSQTLFG